MKIPKLVIAPSCDPAISAVVKNLLTDVHGYKPKFEGSINCFFYVCLFPETRAFDQFVSIETIQSLISWHNYTTISSEDFIRSFEVNLEQFA
jgi:hypothetical protein